MSYWKCSGVGLALAVLLAGCQSSDQGQQAASAPPPDVNVSQVIEREVPDYGDYTGRTDSNKTVDVRSRVNGYLTGIFFTDGQEVKEGQLLFQIDPRPFENDLKNAQGQKKQWEAKKERAVADVQRYEKLVQTGAATPQDVEKAKADRDEAAAAILSAEATIGQAELQLEFSRITAPLTGQIGKAAVSKGNLIHGGGGTDEILATIVSLDPIFVYFDVDERSLLLYRKNATAALPPMATQPDVKDLKIPVYVGLATEEGYPHKGVIDFADNRVNPATGTVKVRGTFDNSKRIFKPGLFARVRVPSKAPYIGTLVSDRAVATDQGQKYVYVVDDKNRAQYRLVKLGRLEEDGLRVIAEGLTAKDWVIVAGLQKARPGKLVNPQRVEMPQIKFGAQTRPAVTASMTADASKTTGQH